MKKKQILIVGAGAAGCFLAANLPKSEKYQVTIIEKSSQPLQKVKVSGGGRCNVTHACFEISELVQNYPRGNKELISIFHRFQPLDTIHWFESKGIKLKTESDNRIFPNSNSSQTIIDCLLAAIKTNNISVKYNTFIEKIHPENDSYLVKTNESTQVFDAVIFCTGSAPSSWKIAASLQHSIVKPLPSLFTFTVKNKNLNDLMGLSFPEVEVSIPTYKLKEKGSLLITHWGFSGPSILRLSAFGARVLAEDNYNFQLHINWIGKTKGKAVEIVQQSKKQFPKKLVYNQNAFQFPQRFWQYVLRLNQIAETLDFATISMNQMERIAETLTNSIYNVTGKSTFKEEFVTSGGIDLKQIDCKTMQSKLHKNLFFAGEILNIDAITGGFNFQACWSEAFIISDFLKKQWA